MTEGSEPTLYGRPVRFVDAGTEIAPGHVVQADTVVMGADGALHMTEAVWRSLQASQEARSTWEP